MKARINRHLLTQTGWDSGSLTPLASVMHRFQEEGTYDGEVLRGDETIGLFKLVVDDTAPDEQVDVDLEAIARRAFARSGAADTHVVSPRQPTLFYVQSGPGGYSVVVRSSDPKNRAVEFDSRELEEGDIFALAPMAPGLYSVTNKDGSEAALVVKERKGRSVPSRPAIVECGGKSLHPHKLTAEWSQPLFYLIKTPSRIRVALHCDPED